MKGAIPVTDKDPRQSSEPKGNFLDTYIHNVILLHSHGFIYLMCDRKCFQQDVDSQIISKFPPHQYQLEHFKERVSLTGDRLPSISRKLNEH